MERSGPEQPRAQALQGTNHGHRPTSHQSNAVWARCLPWARSGRLQNSALTRCPMLPQFTWHTYISDGLAEVMGMPRRFIKDTPTCSMAWCLSPGLVLQKI